MISRVGFWLKFKKLIFGSFAIVCGAITCCLLGSWTENNNNNKIYQNSLVPMTEFEVNVNDSSQVSLSDMWGDEGLFYSIFDFNHPIDNESFIIELLSDEIDTSDFFTNKPTYFKFACFINILDFEGNKLDNNRFDIDTKVIYFYNSQSVDTYFYPDTLYNIDLQYMSQNNFSLKIGLYGITFDNLNSSDVGSIEIILKEYFVNTDYMFIFNEYLDETYVNNEVYNQLNSQKNALQNQYNTLNNNYNNLQQQYNDLDDSFGRLETRYEDLQEDYNELQQHYDDLYNSISFDYSKYSINLVSYPNSQTTQSYSIIRSLSINDYINESGFIDISAIITDNISDFGSVGGWDGISVKSSSYLNLYNYNLLFNGSGSPNLEFAFYYNYFNNVNQFFALPLNNAIGNSYYYGYFDLVGLIEKSNLSLNPNNVAYNEFVIRFLNQPQISDLYNIKLNSVDGYNQGYAQGSRINIETIEDLKTTNTNLQNNLNTLQTNYDTLYEAYQNSQGVELNFTKLMWNIASSPFESFKSIWNVDFLGFNIASFVTGMLSIFIIVWLFKKIFH